MSETHATKVKAIICPTCHGVAERYRVEEVEIAGGAVLAQWLQDECSHCGATTAPA